MRYFFCILFFSCLITTPPASAEGGKIWAVTDQKFISRKTLFLNLEHAKRIFLGIRPENPDHHKYVATIINNIHKNGQKPVVILSYVERSKQNAFAIFAQRHKNSEENYDATGLDMLLGWSNNGQPDWTIVRPVFDLAMLKKLPLKAVNFSRYEIGKLYRNGLGGLPDDVKSDLLPLLKIKPHILQESLHPPCDVLPPEVWAKFMTIHHARNGLFALAMAETGDKTAVLIAPQAHINKKTGVPYYLDKLGGTGKSISLSFLETDQDIPDGQLDYIWYTQKKSRPDSCQNYFTN